MAFVDDVLSRKASFAKLEDRAAQAMHDELTSMFADAQAKLAGLTDHTDAQGNFVDNSKARARMNAVIADILETLHDKMLFATDTLIDARKTAYQKGAMDLQYATEKATGNDFEGSTEQIFKQAARVAATKPVLMDPTNSSKSVKPSEAFDGVEAWTEATVKDVLSTAIIRGSSIPKTAKKLQEAGDVTKRAATRIVRTNVNAAMNDAHDDFYTQNPDVFSGRRWSAVRDSKTSTICADLDGKFWTLQETPPGPPAHPNCRCTLIGVLKDDEMEQDKQDQTMRVKDTATNEYVEARRDSEFEDWLKAQPKDKTRKITGSAVKDELFRKGQLDLDELVKPNLVTRSDKEAVELALAKDPNNASLEALRSKIGALKRSLQEVDVEDALVAAKNKFDAGQAGDVVDAAREQRLKNQPPDETPPPIPPAPPEPKPGDVGFTPKNAKEAIAHFQEFVKQSSVDARLAERKKLQDEIDAKVQVLGAMPFGPEFDAKNAELKLLQNRRDDLARHGLDETERVMELGPRKRTNIKVTPVTPLDIDSVKTANGNIVPEGTVPTKDQLKDAKASLEWAGKFVHRKWSVKGEDPAFTYSSGRANYSDLTTSAQDKNSTQQARFGRILGDGKDRSTMLHEWGHHLEARNPLIHQRCVEFLESRTQGEPEEKLKDITGNPGFKDDEIAKKDKFKDAYMGKIYRATSDFVKPLFYPHLGSPGFKKGDLQYTEILTMGLERMMRNAGEFATNDPEYFKLIYEIMQGTLK